MTYRKTLSQILETFILRKYRSIKKFSEISHIPYSTIMSVIKRGVENTTISTLNEICEALEISLEYLLAKQKFLTFNYKIVTMGRKYKTQDIVNDIIDSNLIEFMVTSTRNDIEDLEKIARLLRKEHGDRLPYENYDD